jgi:pseudouridine-5'-phosphate glycosidase
VAANLALPGSGGLLLVQPPPEDVALPAEDVEAWIAEALAAAEADGVRAGAVTPYVLGHVARASGGRALRANVALIVANARTAARVAVALVERSGQPERTTPSG